MVGCRTTSAGRWLNQRTREICLIGHPKAGSDEIEMERVLIKEEDGLRAVIRGFSPKELPLCFALYLPQKSLLIKMQA